MASVTWSSKRSTGFTILISLVWTTLQGCAPVSVTLPAEPMFAGDYTRVPVHIASSSGLALEDIEFLIPAGPSAGEISLSHDAGFDPANPDIMLLAGHEPGTYALEARNKLTNDLLAEGQFEVVADWANDADGPGLWFAGVLAQSGGVPGAAWGGGPAGVPQNFNAMPATGTRQINIVLVDTSTKRYTTDAATLNDIRDEWLDEISNASDSAATFYNEVSFGKFGLNANIFGPVQLPGTWDDYFEEVIHPTSGTSVWRPANDFYQACATAADGLVNFTSGQTLVCVSQSIDDEQFAWAYARPETVSTAEGTVTVGGISMPFDWEEVDGRPIHTTFSHELGHNLGLGDLYNPELFMDNPPTQKRNVGGWDIMGASGPLPHFTLPNRMLLGWIDQSDIELFNFAVQTPPVDETVTLQPIESGSPPSGRLGAEIRVADGWNYYFEYRNQQSGQIGDNDLPVNNRVFGSDVVSSPFTPPVPRPAVVLFDNDPDFDGSVLGNNQNYREVDASDPMFPTDFTVTASGINGSKADIRVQYGVFSKPDPYIRPWPASADAQWQSPDIEVKNARNATNADWKNVPWIDHDNTIVATVTNGGSLNAEAVEVSFFEKNFNLGGVPIVRLLGTDVHDVAALGKVEFEAPWTPPTGGHYCIQVLISPYTSPGSIDESSTANNMAQSNYSRFISASASPASREKTYVEVGNPFPQATRVFVIPSQTNPYYRTYLEHRWLMLDPGEIAKVEVMFEFAPDAAQKASEQPGEAMRRRPNDVRFASYIEDPRLGPPDAADLFSGAQVEVVTGRATKFLRFDASRNAARGHIVTRDNGQPVPGQRVILDILGEDGMQTYQEVAFTSGTFTAPLPENWKAVSAYYPGRENFSDSVSDTVEKAD